MFFFFYIEVSSFTEDAGRQREGTGGDLGVVWKKGKDYLSIQVRVTSLYKKALHLYTKRIKSLYE